MKARVEKDTFGPIEVPEDHLWGAQTQRSLQFFAISTLVHAMARLKRVAAHVNEQLGELDAQAAQAIMMVADEVIVEKWPAEFPLSVWQTG